MNKKEQIKVELQELENKINSMIKDFELKNNLEVIPLTEDYTSYDGDKGGTIQLEFLVDKEE